MGEHKPTLMVIAGPMGAGKTTFYDAHLKEAFPTLVLPVPHQRKAMLREHRSLAAEDLVVDRQLLESARGAGYTTKVLFISTEDPNLNAGRILIRLSSEGQSVTLNTQCAQDVVATLLGASFLTPPQALRRGNAQSPRSRGRPVSPACLSSKKPSSTTCPRSVCCSGVTSRPSPFRERPA